jgi:HEAT repeat protein
MQKIDPSIQTAQDARVLALDDLNDTVRATAIASMVRNGLAEGTDPSRLLSLSRDESADVRRNLAIALGDLRIPVDDCKVRLRLLAEDSDPAVRLAAVYAFVRLSVNSGENLKRLRQALRSEVVRLRLLAAWALGEVGGAAPWRCRSALKAALRSEQCAEVREALTQALRKLG